ncbi:hypothetical protein AF332_11135 [Sporosarcina globispora]|uniref:Recombinase zinc beta ribbon domain-containing protein n=1 Tax=Sporosarcina globispora TaxID=1459 RepID=A0A0M0GBV4_SPOGL|nr:hypothetical protein [Sporosarcina globispora]KON87324.1 hypothetical protein AF332_11135 [Sporosarcina globispora]
MNPYKSKIICSKCKKRYKKIIESGKVKFICGGYSNNNGCSERTVISEDFIRGLINRRFQKELSDEEIRDVLEYILVEDKLLMEIHFNDRSEPILLKGNFIQF